MKEIQIEYFIIDDSDAIVKALRNSLTTSINKLHLISDPDESFEKINQTKEKIIIVDPYAFSSYGFKIIENLLQKDFPPVVVVMSEKRDPEIIVKLIKSGVYDYIALDRDPYEIEHKIKNACNAVDLQRLRSIHEKELRVLNGYQTVRKSNGKYRPVNQDAALISSIRSSFTQGAGIGSLITLISMIAGRSNPANEGVFIDNSMLEMLKNNSDQVKRVIDAFENMQNLSHKKPEMKYSHIESLYLLLREKVAEVGQFSEKYGKVIKINEQDRYNDIYLQWDPVYLEIILKELLFNAVKFSPNKSEILVFLQDVSHGILISVLNQPSDSLNDNCGIPEEFQSMIFDPFFRISRHVFEDIPTLDFGLGLTTVNLLVKKLNGTIRVSNLESFLPMQKKPHNLVSMEIWLPSYNKSFTGFISDAEKTVSELL